MSCPNRARRAAQIAALLGISLMGALSSSAVAAPPAADTPTSTVLVKLAPDADSADRADIVASLDANASSSLPAGWRKYTLDTPMTAEEARASLADVDAADQVSVPLRLHPAAAPSDPLFGAVNNGYQWGLQNTAAWQGGVAGADISATAGWAAAQGAAPVTVAVLDTGVQIDHPDLKNQLWTNPADGTHGWNFVDHNANVFVSAADDTHGTHVAGIIGAQQNNGVGVAGVAPNARIMALKFIGPNNSGWNTDAISGIQYAVNHGAKIINASFGGPAYDPALCDAIAWAASRGTLFVAAAGNDGRNLDGADAWPAKCPEPSMITVGAFTQAGQMASFSNTSTTYVDVAAPGEWIVSTTPGGYGYMSGTSMATPFVAGVAAEVLGKSPQLTPTQLRQRILDGATVSAGISAAVSGGRRLNMAGALGVAAPAAPSAPVAPADTTPPAAFSALGPADNAAVNSRHPVFSWTASSDGGSGLAYYRLRVDNAVVADRITTTTGAPSADLAAGTHHWQVEAVDNAGNVTASAARTVVIDTTAPSRFTLLSPAAGQAVSGRVSVRWTPSRDAESGLAGYEVLVDGVSVARTGSGGTGVLVMVAAGRHRISVRAADRAGNLTGSDARSVKVSSLRRTALRRRLHR